MRIMLAVDQSKHSEEAIAFLSKQKFTLPIDLDIVSVIMPLPLIDVVGTGSLGVGVVPDIGGVLADEQEFVEERLAKIKDKLKSVCLKVNCHVRVGSPAGEITRLAGELESDLVILGAIGHSAIARVLLGSVSDYVATHASGSVLVIRPPTDGKAIALPNHILVAVGSAQSDLDLLDRLSDFDLPHATTVHLVHVMQTLTFFRQDIVQRTSEIWQQACETATQHLDILHAAIKRRGFASQTKVLEGPHIGEALTEYAEQNQCDMVLACDEQRGLIDRTLLGSTSRYLLRHVHGSVLIVRAARKAEAS